MLSFGGGHPPMDHAPFLLRLWDDEDGVLRVVIALARAGETGAGARTGNAGIDAILDHCRPITPDEDAVYEITFERYILYQTRNESYSSYDAYEVREGQYLIRFRRSRLLDALPLLTDCCRWEDGTCYPGEWTHYGIYTQNHILDVISTESPVIRRVEDKERVLWTD